MLHIGCHLSSSKGYAHMGEEALSIGADTFQFFTRNPRGGSAKPLDAADMEALRVLMAEHGFTLQCEGSVLYGLCRHCAQNAAPSAVSEQPAKKCACCVDTDKNP